MLLVDTNVLIDVLQIDPVWFDWSQEQLRRQSKMHQLAINSVIYAELSLSFSAHDLLDATLADLQVRFLEIPRPALHLAGKAFARYRRAGGIKTNVLPDHFIGAHAAVAQLPLLTRDRRRYATYFPSVQLITPDQ